MTGTEHKAKDTTFKLQSIAIANSLYTDFLHQCPCEIKQINCFFFLKKKKNLLIKEDKRKKSVIPNNYQRFTLLSPRGLRYSNDKKIIFGKSPLYLNLIIAMEYLNPLGALSSQNSKGLPVQFFSSHWSTG